MKQKTIYTFKNRPKGKTDWDRLNKMTEEDIIKAAMSDPDNPPLTAKELAGFKRVKPLPDVDVKKLREDLHFSQTVFSSLFRINKRTLQDWEQGKRTPHGPAKTLLNLIAKDPDGVISNLISLP